MRVLWKLAAPLIASLLVVLPATAQDLSGSIAVETNRPFPEQGLTLKPEEPAIITNPRVTWDNGFYIDVWNGTPDSTINKETDFEIGLPAAVNDRTTVVTSAALFVLENSDEAYRLRADISYQVTDDFSVALNGDIVRGGFETETIRGQAFWSTELIGPFTGNVRAGLSYDTWSKDMVGQWSIGVSVPIADKTDLSVYWSGYTVLSEGRLDRSSDETSSLLGIKLAYGS